MTLLDLLDRPIAFQRCFVTLTGSINAALMLSQAVYWSNRTEDPDGWFYKSRDDWQTETGLTHEQQETARERLKKKGIWEEKEERLLHRVWFRIIEKNLRDQLKEISVSPNRKTRRGSDVKPGAAAPENPAPFILSENTSENTSETKAAAEAFQTAWNSLPDPFPKIIKVSSGRARALHARLKEPGWAEMYPQALERMKSSHFLRGGNDRNWKADPEFFLRPDTVTKILEGKYDNAGTASPAQVKAQDEFRKHL